MSKIIINQREYILPILPTTRFQELQENIRTHHQRIQAIAPSHSFFRRFIKRLPKPLSFEERFEELHRLIQDYNELLNLLQEHKTFYDRLFRQLKEDISLTVTEKCNKFLHLEQKRLTLEREAAAEHDEALLEMTQSQREQLFRSIRLLGKAVLLLLKKIDLFSTSLKRLAEDHELQKQVLGNMTKCLDRHYRVYQLQKEINALEEEIADMANVAVNFEEYMRDYLGPFQDLIEQVTEADSKLSSAVEEIEQITSMILTEEEETYAIQGSEEFDTQILDFLIQSRMKRERLTEVLKQAMQETASSELFELEMRKDLAEPNSIAAALNNIQTLVDVWLPQREILRIKDQTGGLSPLFPYNPQMGPLPSQIVDSIVGIEFVLIPAGSFMMGSDKQQEEQPRHWVSFGSPFYLGKYPITQTQWMTIMRHNPSYFKGKTRPVENVSWSDVQEFIHHLNEQAGKNIYRLPSEAEWEYACRAGTDTAYYFGDAVDELDKYAWYSKNSGNATHPVGQLQPNTWGLYDMHGNVWEWCADTWFGGYHNTLSDGDLLGTSRHYKDRLLRGGAWVNTPEYCRSACRGRLAPDIKGDSYGFRLVIVLM